MMSAHETTTTLTDLLNSLHTHLQVQTQLLPTLHSQLGLPRSALEDDLKALHRELVQGVEVQVERRRREVDEWMARCDEAENECIRYSRALGGNVKSTGATIGELRKEAVLPRRCELVTEHQEKLRQLYHAKLEQLTTITNRIHSLARTLGPSFFSMDVLEPCTADGEDDLDPESYRDVTPDRFLKLEKELKRGKVELGNRLALLADIFLHIDWLYRELRLSPSTFSDLNSDSPSIISTACPSAQSPGSDPFLNTPTPHPRTNSLTTGSLRDDTHESHDFEYQRVFAQFVARIALLGDQELPVNQGVPFGLEHVDPSPGLLAWAKELQASLEDIKRRRETYIQAMYDQLETLWWRFGIKETEMSEFVEAHKGSTEEVIRKYEGELERMLEMKREHMGAFIGGARQEIVQLWDDLMIGEDEKAEFAPFVDDEHTEELLAIHEEEIRRLKEDRRLKAPLLATVRKYFDICEEAKELALAAADQTRLLGRGPRDPGRLLREEKTRKRVSKEKPRLEQDLLSSIPAWEEETGRPFLVNGESFLPMLMEAVAASDQENRRRPPRAGSVPPRATTPVNSTTSHAVGPRTGAVTPAVRSSSSASQSVPNKHQKLNDGHKAVRAPLTNHRSNGAHTRPGSPSRLPKKTPRTLHKSKSLSIPVPKSGMQHQALGHGRAPGTMAHSSGLRSASAGAKASSVGVQGKLLNSIKSLPGAGSSTLGKASRAKRESFKPRPSEDNADLGRSGGIGNSRWGGSFTSSVKEEEGEDN